MIDIELIRDPQESLDREQQMLFQTTQSEYPHGKVNFRITYLGFMGNSHYPGATAWH